MEVLELPLRLVPPLFHFNHSYLYTLFHYEIQLKHTTWQYICSSECYSLHLYKIGIRLSNPDWYSAQSPSNLQCESETGPSLPSFISFPMKQVSNSLHKSNALFSLYKKHTGYTQFHRDRIKLIEIWIPAKFNKKHLKNVGPIRHCEPPHAHSPGFASGTVARHLRIDVHDNDNDNAWQKGPLWPHGMGPINR